MTGVWYRGTSIPELTPAMNPAESVADCPICFESYKSPPTVTSCSHEMCQTCMSKCLDSQSMCCPLCRKLLLKEKAKSCFPHETIALGLFILNSNFFAVPGGLILLRVFEPRYLLLVRRCIESKTCFGLQAGFNAGCGLLVTVKRHREIEGGHIIMEGIAIGRYMSICPPKQEADTFGLYTAPCCVLTDNVLDKAQAQEFEQVANQCRKIFDERVIKLSAAEQNHIRTQCGPCPSGAGQDFAFWVLGALNSTEDKAAIVFSKDSLSRIRFVLRLLESNASFNCIKQ